MVKDKKEEKGSKPQMSKNAVTTYQYLKKDGAKSPLQISKDLDLDTRTVMNALKELKDLGRIVLLG